jgi:SAM-dependent methyltransferase
MSDARKDRLTDFVKWVRQTVKGDEKGEAHIFVDHLFQAFGQKGCLDVGGVAEYRVRPLEDDDGGVTFADYVWKPVVLIEMKKRKTDLSKHFRQLFDYWIRLVPDRPQYCVLCNFDEFWIYDFNVQMDSPLDQLKLEDVPGRSGPLAFLFPTNEKPHFHNNQEAVTREKAAQMAKCFNSLVARDIPREKAQAFILQMLVAIFAEDIGLLEEYFVTGLLEECETTPKHSYDILGGLFDAMNTPGRAEGGRYAGVDYFNGGLFKNPARIELTKDEVKQLLDAADGHWSQVRPEIFGTIFEHSLDKGERHALGAHFTNIVDIMKIVGPTIVEPWRAMIDNAGTQRELLSLRKRLTEVTVLDPACGSGNFLYIAYREMKRLEARIFDRMRELSVKKGEKQTLLGFVHAGQFYGMDISPFAIELAKVTMMIGRKLAIDELKMPEAALPLDNLDNNFFKGDALRDELGAKPEWPPADVIIGNPPFLGAKRLKPKRGAEYIRELRKLYPTVPGMADYCVYWIDRTHKHLPISTAEFPERGRAGLVGTQNIRNNESRVGGLDKVVLNGTIVEAVENQPWSGEADVNVSIANWVKHSPEPSAPKKGATVKPTVISTAEQQALLIPKRKKLWFLVEQSKATKKIRKRGAGSKVQDYELDCRECDYINSSLSDLTTVSGAAILKCNTKPQRVFQGVTPGYAGFVLKPQERAKLIAKSENARALTAPYIIGRELMSKRGEAKRYLIDVDAMDLLEVAGTGPIYDHLRQHVLTAVEEKVEDVKGTNEDMVEARQEHLQRWWTYWARRKELRQWMQNSKRMIVSSRTQRWPFIFLFLSCRSLPGDKLQAFAFEDDYSFGVISALPHLLWYKAKAARLKNEVDYNYSSRSIFATFPWPQAPRPVDVTGVAEASRELRRARVAALESIKGGLREAYHTLAVPGKNSIRDAHDALDAAVLKAYGFSAKKDILKQVLDLNKSMVARIKAKEEVTPPGIPPNFAKPESLITDDCLRPELTK